MRSTLALLAAVVLVLVNTSRVVAEQSAEAVAVDAYGDPLPKGARLRLGTLRLRQDDFLYAVKYSPDGNLLASCGGSNVVYLWDAHTWKLVRTFCPEHDLIRALAFSSDGRLLGCGGRNERGPQVHVWNVQSGILEAACAVDGKDNRDLYSLDISDEGKYIAAGDYRGGMHIWEIPSGTLVMQTKVADRDVECVRFLSNSRLIAGGGGKLSLFSIKDKALLATQAAHKDELTSLIVLPDQKAVLTAGVKYVPDGPRRVRGIGDIKSWDLPNLTPSQRQPIQDSFNSNLSLALVGHSQLAIGQYDGISIWDVESGSRTKSLPGYQNTYGLLAQRIDVSSDGRTLVAAPGSQVSYVQAWDTESGQQLFQIDAHQGRCTHAFCSSAGGHIVTAGQEGTVRYWDPATSRQRRVVDRRAVTISADGKWVAANNGIPVIRRDSVIRLVDANTDLVADSFEIGPRFIQTAEFSSDGELFAVATFDYRDEEFQNRDFKVHVWNVARGEEVAVISAHQFDVRRLLFSPVSKRLYLVGMSRELCVWDFAKSQIEFARDLAEGANYARSVALFPDGETLAVAVGRQSIIEIQQLSGEAKLRIPIPASAGAALAVSGDGNLIATAAGGYTGPRGELDRSIYVWDTATGTERFHFPDYESRVCTLSFSSDNQSLISGMANGTALVWDLR
jgi:WD40 repeat protein